MVRAPKILLVAAVASGLIAVCAGVVWRRRQSAPASPSAALTIASRLESAKKPESAALVIEACKKDPCQCASVAGRQGLDIDAHVEVLEVLAAATPSCPDQKDTAGIHAEAVARLGETERARNEANQVLASDPNSPFALHALALNAYRAAKTKEALAFALRAIDAGRGAPAHLLAGLIAYNQNDLAEAGRHFRAALDAEPNNLEGLYDLALVAQKSNRYTEAREGFLRVANLDPTHKNARYNLAVLAHSIGADDEANHHLAKFESLAPGDKRIGELRSLLGSKPENSPPGGLRVNNAVVRSAPAPSVKDAVR